MTLRRYLAATAALALGVGVVLYIVLIGTQTLARPGGHHAGTAEPSAITQPTVAEPGDTVTLAEPGEKVTLTAVDNAGPYGTITVIRGEVRPVRDDERERADASNATTVLDVHIAYLPARASGASFGTSDWGYAVEFDDGLPTTAQLLLPITNTPDPLGTAPPGSSAALSGTIAIPITRGGADGTVVLLYGPILEPRTDATRVRLPTS
jgi:hypothetical protein